MEEKKKRKYDRVPDIYMNGGRESCFFRPHYPVEDSDYAAAAIFEEENALDIYSGSNADNFPFEQNLQG